MVDGRHCSDFHHRRNHGLCPRRVRQVHRDPELRPLAVHRHAAQDGGRLPDRRLRHPPVAAGSGGAGGRRRIRPARHPHRHDDGRGAAGRAAHHLPGRGRLPAARRRRRNRGRLHHRLESARLQSRADLGGAVLRAGIRRLAHLDRAAAADRRRSPGARRVARDRVPLGRRPMSLTLIISIVVSIVLWTLVSALALTAAVRSKALFREGAWEGSRDFVVLIPRVLIGVVGSGYIAVVMPQELITTWLGPNSGLVGILIATVAGAATPGGAVVGFSIGAAALKGGAGAPQVIAYTTAWSLYTLQRLINWEIHMMAPRVVWLRAAVSIPLPILAGIAAMLIGKP